MSISKEGVQKCLNYLESCCDKWKLEINTKKRKVVLFNRQGSLITKHKFYYKQRCIDVVRDYKYLAFVFTCAGSNNGGITNIINQPKKNWFSIQYYLSSSKNKNIDTYPKLYDSLVKPILLYACEAWADSLKIDTNIKNLLQKQIRKVPDNCLETSTNGRHPITVNIRYRTIKNFLRLPYLDKDRLLYKSCEEEIKTYNNKDTNFISYIINTLNNIGMSNI